MRSGLLRLKDKDAQEWVILAGLFAALMVFCRLGWMHGGGQ